MHSEILFDSITDAMYDSLNCQFHKGNKYVVLTKIKSNTDFAYLIYSVKTREEHRRDEEAAPRKLINWAALKEQSDQIRDTKFAGDDANTLPTK